MPNPNARKGREAELLVARYLVDQGWSHAEATRRSGWSDDRGDIDGIPGFTVEVKSAKQWRVPEWLGELSTEMDNAGNDAGVLVVKRRGSRDVGTWYAINEMCHYTRLMRDAGW